MKIKKIYFAMAALMVSGAMLTSCSDDDSPKALPQVSHVLTLDMPLGLENVELKDASVTVKNVETGKTLTFQNGFQKVNGVYTDTITVEQGYYNMDVTGDITYTIDSTVVNSKVKASRQNVSLADANTIGSSKFGLSTYNAKEGFVISEIFFTGTLTPDGKQYSDDQYFKIANNSDSTLYLDGLAIVESSFLTVEKQDYTPDIMNEAMTADAIYLFPGNGTDYPVAPGKEILVALNARNHKEFNTNSFDLSKADFEIYDESESPSFVDNDNPDVPNLINWYDYSASYFSLHNRGFKSYALAKPEVDKDTFIKDYLYKYTYVFKFGEYSFDMDDEGYKIPNTWIVDAVNLSVSDSFQWIVTSPTLDAGWAHCGSVDHDKTRYGKAVVRKKANGKWVDTNNSTDDFESDAKPTVE